MAPVPAGPRPEHPGPAVPRRPGLPVETVGTCWDAGVRRVRRRPVFTVATGRLRALSPHRNMEKRAGTAR